MVMIRRGQAGTFYRGQFMPLRIMIGNVVSCCISTV